MNRIACLTVIAACIRLVALSPAAEYNLQKLEESGGLKPVNRTIATAPAESPGAIRLSMAAGDGIAWIQDLDFAEGSLQVALKGADRPGQSFVGLAFHGSDDGSYDAVYLRPFNFRNKQRRGHALQYISMPQHDWRALRQSHPGRYEAAVDPAPDPNDWIRLRLEISGATLQVFVNDGAEPALITKLLPPQRRGHRVGLWVGNNSDGAFRQLAARPSLAPSPAE